jgi:hypothetical protein
VVDSGDWPSTNEYRWRGSVKGALATRKSASDMVSGKKGQSENWKSFENFDLGEPRSE